MPKSYLHGRAILGVVLVLFGLSMLGRSLNIFSSEVEDILFSWPMLLIVLGGVFLFAGNQNVTGVILLLIGIVFLLPRFIDIPFSLREVFWPVLFIGVGLLILTKTLTRSTTQGVDSGGDTIDDVAILGGNERRITSKSFKGGKVTSIFGGSQLNFSEAALADGNSVIDLFSMFGGCTLIVPKDWEVKVEVTSILGGFADKRVAWETDNTKNKVLVIRGMAIFGGGEIKTV